jgi:hypothetical protein
MRLFEFMSEDLEAAAASADRNLKTAKKQKQQCRVNKTKDLLHNQQNQLLKIIGQSF